MKKFTERFMFLLLSLAAVVSCARKLEVVSPVEMEGKDYTDSEMITVVGSEPELLGNSIPATRSGSDYVESITDINILVYASDGSCVYAGYKTTPNLSKNEMFNVNGHTTNESFNVYVLCNIGSNLGWSRTSYTESQLPEISFDLDADSSLALSKTLTGYCPATDSNVWLVNMLGTKYVCTFNSEEDANIFLNKVGILNAPKDFNPFDDKICKNFDKKFDEKEFCPYKNIALTESVDVVLWCYANTGYGSELIGSYENYTGTEIQHFDLAELDLGQVSTNKVVFHDYSIPEGNATATDHYPETEGFLYYYNDESDVVPNTIICSDPSRSQTYQLVHKVTETSPTGVQTSITNLDDDLSFMMTLEYHSSDGTLISTRDVSAAQRFTVYFSDPDSGNYYVYKSEYEGSRYQFGDTYIDCEDTQQVIISYESPIEYAYTYRVDSHELRKRNVWIDGYEYAQWYVYANVQKIGTHDSNYGQILDTFPVEMDHTGVYELTDGILYDEEEPYELFEVQFYSNYDNIRLYGSSGSDECDKPTYRITVDNGTGPGFDGTVYYTSETGSIRVNVSYELTLVHSDPGYEPMQWRLVEVNHYYTQFVTSLVFINMFHRKDRVDVIFERYGTNSGTVYGRRKETHYRSGNTTLGATVRFFENDVTISLPEIVYWDFSSADKQFDVNVEVTYKGTTYSRTSYEYKSE